MKNIFKIFGKDIMGLVKNIVFFLRCMHGLISMQTGIHMEIPEM